MFTSGRERKRKKRGILFAGYHPDPAPQKGEAGRGGALLFVSLVGIYSTGKKLFQVGEGGVVPLVTSGPGGSFR